MQAKNTIATACLSGKKVTHILEWYYEINHLKQLFRQGWLRHLSPEKCETVAEHSFSTALLAWVIADEHFPKLDSAKILKLALLHDIGEIYAGDITPADNIPSAEKKSLEQDAVNRILMKLKNGSVYRELWKEYETGETPEAKFVKEIDKLEMALQASVYEHQYDLDLQPFFQSAEKRLDTPALIAIFETLNAIRQSL